MLGCHLNIYKYNIDFFNIIENHFNIISGLNLLINLKSNVIIIQTLLAISHAKTVIAKVRFHRPTIRDYFSETKFIMHAVM